MKKRIALAGLSLGLGLMLSCAIEDFNTTPALNTPLGLTARFTTNYSSTTNRIIQIRFWGMNNETYFSGYEIFVADSAADLTNMTNSYRKLPNANGETNVSTSNDLTIMANPVNEPTWYSFNMTVDTNQAPLVDSQTYFIWVRAYSYTWNSFSLPSNWTNVTYHSL